MIVDYLIYGLTLALWIEFATVYARYGIGLESTRDTKFLSKFTFGFRIHHGYIGLLIGIPGILFSLGPLAVIGIGLFLSDVIHHGVLWFFEGNAQFHLRYESLDPCRASGYTRENSGFRTYCASHGWVSSRSDRRKLARLYLRMHRKVEA